MYSVIVSRSYGLVLFNETGESVIDIEGKVELSTGPVRVFELDPGYVVYAVSHGETLTCDLPVLMLTDGVIVTDKLPEVKGKSVIPALLAAGIAGFVTGKYANKESNEITSDNNNL